MDHATRLLLDSSEGQKQATDELTPLVYGELRALSRRILSPARSGPLTLQPTALVHEAYLKLIDQREASVKSTTHFRALAAVAMRHVLVDHLRSSRSAKRGGDRQRVTITGLPGDGKGADPDVERLEEALSRFEEVDARAARVVELLFFGGLTQAEAAAELGVSERTVRDDWKMARAWLRTEMQRSGG